MGPLGLGWVQGWVSDIFTIYTFTASDIMKESVGGNWLS